MTGPELDDIQGIILRGYGSFVHVLKQEVAGFEDYLQTSAETRPPDQFGQGTGFERFVITRGSAYCFLPSITGLRYIAAIGTSAYQIQLFLLRITKDEVGWVAAARSGHDLVRDQRSGARHPAVKASCGCRHPMSLMCFNSVRIDKGH